MQDVLIDIERKLDTVLIENQYQYPAFTSVHVNSKGQYEIKVEFLNPDKAAVAQLATFYKLSKTLSFKSRVMQKEGLDVSQVFVTRHLVDLSPSVQWDCISK